MTIPGQGGTPPTTARGTKRTQTTAAIDMRRVVLAVAIALICAFGTVEVYSVVAPAYARGGTSIGNP